MDYSAYLKPGETLETVSESTLKKRKHDQKLREQKHVPSHAEWCEEYAESPASEELKYYLDTTKAKIAQELEVSYPEPEDAIGFALIVSYCYANRLVKKTSSGPMTAYIFPDVVGGVIVAGKHRRDLTRSKTFSDIYWPLLKLLETHFGKNIESDDKTFRQEAIAVRQELDGKFVLHPSQGQPQPEPKPIAPEPEPPTVPPAPSTVAQTFAGIDRSLDQAAKAFLMAQR